MVTVTFSVTRVKVLSSKLLALDAIVVECDQLRTGEPILVHMNHKQELFLDIVSSLPKAKGNQSTGSWNKVTGLPLYTVESLPVFPNRKGTKVVECTDDKETMHPTLHPKQERHRVFARWIVETFGVDHVVLDVAGGKGHLSQCLLELGVSKVVLIDPVPRVEESSSIHIIAEGLVGDGSNLLPLYPALREVSLIVGMHPDQATEPAVDLARRLSLPWAVIPCCVMPSLFPGRLQSNGLPLRSYSRFCEYLRFKSDFSEQQQLPFIGRNTVIFRQRT